MGHPGPTRGLPRGCCVQTNKRSRMPRSVCGRVDRLPVSSSRTECPSVLMPLGIRGPCCFRSARRHGQGFFSLKHACCASDTIAFNAGTQSDVMDLELFLQLTELRQELIGGFFSARHPHPQRVERTHPAEIRHPQAPVFVCSRLPQQARHTVSKSPGVVVNQSIAAALRLTRRRLNRVGMQRVSAGRRALSPRRQGERQRGHRRSH